MSFGLKSFGQKGPNMITTGLLSIIDLSSTARAVDALLDNERSYARFDHSRTGVDIECIPQEYPRGCEDCLGRI